MKTSTEQVLRHLWAIHASRQIKSIRRHLKRVIRDRNAEDIHQLRVASRRLRSGLKVFSDVLPKKKSKRWRKSVRDLTRTFGTARDLDVQIEFLRNHEGELTDATLKRGVERMMATRAQERQDMQDDLDLAARAAIKSAWLDQMRGTIKSYLRRSTPTPGQSPAEVYQLIQNRIQEALDAFVSHQDALADPSQRDQHHEMRIDGKRLRYALELFGPAYTDQLKPILRVMKKLQTLLGDIHDCDVWIEQLTLALEDAAETDSPTEPSVCTAMENLIADRQAERGVRFTQLCVLWKSTVSSGVWADLPQKLQPH